MIERTHQNRKHPQLWKAVLRTTASYTVGSLSPLFERLDITVNLFLVIATGRDRGVGEAGGALVPQNSHWEICLSPGILSYS